MRTDELDIKRGRLTIVGNTPDDLPNLKVGDVFYAEGGICMEVVERDGCKMVLLGLSRRRRLLRMAGIFKKEQ